MFEEVPFPEVLSLKFAARAQLSLLPFIRNQSSLQARLGLVLEDKGDGHYAYEIDEFANSLLFEMLAEHGVGCRVFSEEGGWSTVGKDTKYYVICDPYCNTSLTMRGFRESAVAICIADLNGGLVSCAIADLQVDRIFYADQGGASLWNLDNRDGWQSSSMQVSSVEKLGDAFVVASLLKQSRRLPTCKSGFYSKAKFLHGVDGAIMIGRLAAGHIDAYLDPFVGQPIYEVPCCEMVVRAGGVVSDIGGRPFSLAHIIEGLVENPKIRYSLVAACTAELHRELLLTLSE